MTKPDKLNFRQVADRLVESGSWHWEQNKFVVYNRVGKHEHWYSLGETSIGQLLMDCHFPNNPDVVKYRMLWNLSESMRVYLPVSGERKMYGFDPTMCQMDSILQDIEKTLSQDRQLFHQIDK